MIEQSSSLGALSRRVNEESDNDRWARLLALLGDDLGGAGASPASPVTSNFHAMTASQSFDIPAGAKGWSVSILTGTGTVGGAAVSLGFSDSDPRTTATAITISTGVTSTAYVRYGS